MGRCGALIISLLLATGGAMAGPFDDGIASYDRGDYAAAMRLWRPLALGGHAAAQFNLATMYSKGIGVPKDLQEAFSWFRKAADQGHAPAQFDAASMYYRGEGVANDDQQAAFWFRKAADQGHTGAQINLALLYRRGQGVPRDLQQASVWYRKAADQGDAGAQFSLGMMYSNDAGIPKDLQEAFSWFRKAADQGHAGAQTFLADMFDRGQGVPKDLQQASFWYHKAADQGDASAQFLVGLRYFTGNGVPKDIQQSYFWFLLSSVDGHAESIRFRNLVETRLTSSERAAAQAEARNWKPTTATATVVEPKKPQARSDGRPDSTGSGFRVANGRIVTNNHVVESCARIRVNGNDVASVLARDVRNDMAIVSADGDRGQSANLRGARTRLGEDVTVAGFPLQGLLTGLSITKGNVSRLSGLAGDSRLLQISAPVQPGNSGGPLLDAGANVIGVVVSKLDALRVAKATGDIPQNVNFALNASVLRSFLDASGVEYADGKLDRPLSATEIAGRAGHFTVLIECWN